MLFDIAVALGSVIAILDYFRLCWAHRHFALPTGETFAFALFGALDKAFVVAQLIH